MKTSKLIAAFLLVSAVALVVSCDFEFELPDSNSQIDTDLPEASFSFDPVGGDDWQLYQFVNTSVESNVYSWDFGTGDTSTEVSPTYRFDDGEGTYTVSLTASDSNGETSTFTQSVVVVEPEVPPTPDPELVNADFNKLPKSSGSDCSCSGWINKSLGEQGESSSGNGGSDNLLKFDNAEPDHVYQEFAVEPNADYQIDVITQFKSLETGTFPSQLEIRVLAGTGYGETYTPVYYDNTADMPQDDWGYTSIAQVENPANNLFVTAMSNPGDDSYLPNTFMFNSGANTSVALFIRGIGNADPPEDPADFAMYGYCSGEEEIRLEHVIITAIND
ncbi:MAG: PKD domain-containing protein [Saprospiraceae bacterium]|nr:PKD domain-containing protein [Saprospiraceae bacterium]